MFSTQSMACCTTQRIQQGPTDWQNGSSELDELLGASGIST